MNEDRISKFFAITFIILFMIVIFMSNKNARHKVDYKSIAEAELQHIWSLEHMINSVDSITFSPEDWEAYNKSMEKLTIVVKANVQ